jgi:hypothetical protein
MSQPFVKIMNNKLSLVGSIPNGNPRVISILGKARMGKSTFLNAIVSHLRNSSQAPFKAMDCDDHCTRGIDSFYMEDQNLLLLDSQGLDYEDASHDPHLLLLLYILSDVIIFNDTRRLENGALKLMEPVCAFTNYLDIDTVVKPKLFFRIFDSDVKDAAKNLEKVLGTYQDQYQSIRNSIKHLFHSDISLLKTESLDRPAKMMLANNMYRELLNEPLGFRDAIQTILVASQSAEKKSVLGSVPDFIHKINSNEEIAIEKLDVVKLQAENDIHKWIQDSVPAEDYSEMTVDGTQKSFEQVVEPRKNRKKAHLTAFTKRFKDVEESIRGPFYKALAERLDKPIQNAIESSRQKAMERVKIQNTNAHATRDFPVVNSLTNSFTTVPSEYWHTYLGVFNTLEASIDAVFEPIKKELSDWISQIRFVLNRTLDTIRDEEIKEKQAVSKVSAEMLLGMSAWMVKYVEDLDMAKVLTQNNNEIMNEVKNAYIAEFEKQIQTLIPRRKVYFKMTATGILVPCIEMLSGTNIQTYDLIKTIYDTFVDKVTFFTSNLDTEVRISIVEQKEAFLVGKLLPSSTPIKGGQLDGIQGWRMHPWTQKVITANPEIQFIDDEIIRRHLQMPIDHNSYSVLTSRTHFDTFGILYSQTINDLLEKKYVTQPYSSQIIHAETHQPGKETVINAYACQTKYDAIVGDLFIKRLQKNFCKKTVEGFAFPVIYHPQ